MIILDASYCELEEFYKAENGLLARIETKVSYLAGEEQSRSKTTNVLENVTGNSEAAIFRLFHPEIELGGRYKEYEFYVDSFEKLKDDRKVYNVRQLGSLGLSREFIVTEPSLTEGRTPGEVSYVAFSLIESMAGVDIEAEIS